jgi:ribosomal protein L6P/L9E
MKIKIYNLKKKKRYHVFFQKHLNTFIIIGSLGIKSLVLPKILVNFLANNSFLTPTKIFFFFYTLSLKNLFFSLFSKALVSTMFGYITEINIVGIGYRVWCNFNNLIVDFGLSHLFGLYISDQVAVCCKKTTLLLYSIHADILGEYASILVGLKKCDRYKGKGLYFKNKNLKLKPGKQRQR